LLKVESIVDSARKYLEACIIRGAYKPGQQVKEQEVASSLGISRPPIREAFKILEAEGFLRREPRRGVFVSELNGNDIWEIYTLKIALYTLAVTLAMDRMSKADIDRLEGIVREMEGVVSKPGKKDLIRYEDLNHLFHETTAEIAGHRRLGKILQSLNNQIKRIALGSFADPKHLRDSCRYHRSILEAIKAGDRTLAERLTREHILRGLAVHEKHSGIL
jgi:DNA-binding GntR family transcriptional regulator